VKKITTTIKKERCVLPIGRIGNYIYLSHAANSSAKESCAAHYQHPQTLSHYDIPRDRILQLFSASGPFLTFSLVLLYINAEHASYSDMKACPIRAALWNEQTHFEASRAMKEECA
jgi:hypothetical protein